MDYCYQCRRHLNGALTCAGCGTAAEELRHRTPHPPEQSGAESDDHGEYADNSRGHAVDEDELLVAGHGPTHGPAGRTPSRRRAGARKKRAKRNRRIVVGVFGFVLVAGGLGLAQLATAPPSNRADSVKEATPVAVDGSLDASDGPADPSAPGDTAQPETTRPAGATDSSASPSDGDSPGDSASAVVAAPSPHASATSGTQDASETAKTSDDRHTPQHGHHTHGSGGSAPQNPGPASPTGGPSSQSPSSQAPSSPSPDPRPTPSKTEECHRILWWCA